MERSPKISVLMPCYRQEQFVGEAIASLLAQDFWDWELVASDDASPDDTAARLEKLAQGDKRIRFFRQPRNLGMVENWNFCLQKARGKAIKLMGGDDRLSRTDCLSRQWQKLQLPQVALVACGRAILNEHSQLLETIVNLPETVLPSDTVLARILEHHDNLIGEPVCCLFRKADAERGFDTGYRQNTDIEMWLYLLKKGGLAYDPLPLVSFRRHESQASVLNWQTGLALEEHRMLFLREALRQGLPPQTKFQVLLRAENAFRQRPSEKIRLAMAEVKAQLGPLLLAWLRLSHRASKTTKRLRRSFLKRLPLLKPAQSRGGFGQSDD